jgi:beta-galactosidase GanA
MRILLSAILSFAALIAPNLTAQNSTPHIEQRGANPQLIVDGKPYLMLAGELHNSSSSSLEYMKPVWPRMAAMHLNTVLTPLSWELVEPTEGHYDFSLVDGLLAQAREQHLHVVFLWLAAWKNGMSGYPPVWVKQDTKRFPRVVLNGSEVNILSTFAPATREADARAFAAVMRHIKEVDSTDHTVLMVQVENEVGILGAARDHSAIADREFAAPVPAELMKYLAAHKDTLDPELRSLWEENGSRTSGTWAQVFGPSDRADELFMAWHYAAYVHAVAAKGKEAYALPLFVNTWLGGGTSKPGDYPSGGPQPRVTDVWKAARSLEHGPSIDIYTPDLYASDFSGWAAKYHRDGNPFFLPETNGGEAGAANIFYATGEHATLGFSPFGIDSLAERDKTGTDELTASYTTIEEIAPALLEAQGNGLDGHGNPKTHGFLLDKAHPSADFNMGDLIAHVSLDDIFGQHAEKGFGLIIQTGPDEFLGAGKGFRVSFTRVAASDKNVGIAAIDEGHFVNGSWVAGRRLNGDENDQGSYWRFDQRALHIEKARLYRYE